MRDAFIQHLKSCWNHFHWTHPTIPTPRTPFPRRPRAVGHGCRHAPGTDRLVEARALPAGAREAGPSGTNGSHKRVILKNMVLEFVGVFFRPPIFHDGWKEGMSHQLQIGGGTSSCVCLFHLHQLNGQTVRVCWLNLDLLDSLVHQLDTRTFPPLAPISLSMPVDASWLLWPRPEQRG